MNKKHQVRATTYPTLRRGLQLWLGLDSVILIFCILFGMMIAVFMLVLQTDFFQTNIFIPHLHQTASICGKILGLFGKKYKIVESSVFSPDFSLSLIRGCDSIYPTAMLWSAILAFSAPWRSKVIGLAIGAILLYCINVVRILSMFFLGAYFPSFFDMVHIYAWQSLFILLTLSIFLIWVMRIRR